MGMVYANIELTNPRLKDLRSMQAQCLVDSSAFYLCIPEHVRLQLELKELEKREVTLADGSKKLASYVGPIQVSFENRKCFTGALVLGEMVLLGAIPMEDMDVLIHPMQQKLIVNPNSPNIASGLVMGHQSKPID